jgi:hypothetical protein
MSELFATFGINGKLLVVQLVNFGILLAALTYLLYKPLMTLMEERAQFIGKGVKDAEAAQKKLAAAEADRFWPSNLQKRFRWTMIHSALPDAFFQKVANGIPPSNGCLVHNPFVCQHTKLNK